MASDGMLIRNRHIVSVVALLVSSAGGFVIAPHRHIPAEARRDCNYLQPSSQGQRQQQHPRRRWKPAEEDATWSLRSRGALSAAFDENIYCAATGTVGNRRLELGLSSWNGRCLSSAADGKRTVGGRCRPVSLTPSSADSGRTRRWQYRSSLSMSLHFPDNRKRSNAPPPSTKGDAKITGGKGEQKDSASRQSPSNASAAPKGLPGADRNSSATAVDAKNTGVKRHGTLHRVGSISSSKIGSSSKKASSSAAEKSGGVGDGTRAGSRKSPPGNATAAGNGTRTEVNGSKTPSRRYSNSRLPSADIASIPLPGTSRSRTEKVAAAFTRRDSKDKDKGEESSVLGEKRRLKRVPRSPSVDRAAGAAGQMSKRRPLVVTDDMDLKDVTSLVKEILERVSETERELRRLRKEGSVTTTRSSVRERKFVIDDRAKTIGAAFAGSLAGMVLGWSILPNLWLLGAVVGAVACAAFSRTAGPIGTFCSTCGIQVALIYKDIRDWWEQTVFLYKTGKLSYTYWKGFEKYDKAWGLTEKYNNTLNKVSKEALELDRQYKIRAKTLRAGKRLTKLSKQFGTSAYKEVTHFAGTATDWGGTQLQQWGLLGEDGGNKKGFGFKRWKASRGGDGSNRPLGLSDFGSIFGERRQSLYSAPAAGASRMRGYHGDPLIPARIRHLFMTPKQIRDERLKKYRVGFMGIRIPRSFDKDD